MRVQCFHLGVVLVGIEIALGIDTGRPEGRPIVRIGHEL